MFQLLIQEYWKRNSISNRYRNVGDYNSVIGMDKDNSIKKFFKDKDAIKHFPSHGEGTLSGIVVEADVKSGLAKKVLRLIIGGVLN